MPRPTTHPGHRSPWRVGSSQELSLGSKCRESRVLTVLTSEGQSAVTTGC